MEDFVYNEADSIETSFCEDEVICLLTDGVFESFNERGDALGQENLNTLLRESVEVNSCLMLPHLLYDLIGQKGYTVRNDDFSFIALQRIPSSTRCLRYYRELNSMLSQVDEVGEELQSFLAGLGASDELGFKTRLVATEFLNNIVEHGLPKHDSEKIALEVLYAEQVTVIIRDGAVEWEPPEKEPLMEQFFDGLNDNLDDRGRGLQIVYAMTDSFSRRRIHTINETVMTIAEGA